MDYLREGIGLRALAQKDPLVEYKSEGFDLFGSMLDAIQVDFVRYICHLETAPRAGGPTGRAATAGPAGVLRRPTTPWPAVASPAWERPPAAAAGAG